MRKMFLAMALVLAGCASSGDNPGTQSEADAFVQRFAEYTIKDLTHADQLAVNSHDAVAHNCWSALIPEVQMIAGDAASGAKIGLATALQVKRDLQNEQSPVSLGCAALVQSEKKSIFKLVLQGAAAGAMM